MAKNKNRGMMARSDIPYAQRLRMQQQSSISANREHAARVTLYCMSVAMNELEGIGYRRLIRFARRYRQYEDEFYQDIHVGMAHAKHRMEQMGMPISGEFFSERIEGKTKRQQEVHDHALQAIQVALTVGAIAMNDEFGFAQTRQMKLSKRVTELSEQYAEEGEAFLLEDMKKIGFLVKGGIAYFAEDDVGNVAPIKTLANGGADNGF